MGARSEAEAGAAGTGTIGREPGRRRRFGAAGVAVAGRTGSITAGEGTGTTGATRGASSSDRVPGGETAGDGGSEVSEDRMIIGG